MELTVPEVVQVSILATFVLSVIGFLSGFWSRKVVDAEIRLGMAIVGLIVALVAAAVMAFQGVDTATGYEIAGFVLALSSLFGFLGLGLSLASYKPG